MINCTSDDTHEKFTIADTQSPPPAHNTLWRWVQQTVQLHPVPRVSQTGPVRIYNGSVSHLSKWLINHRSIVKCIFSKLPFSRSQWPRGLRRGFAAARLMGLWVRIPPGIWMSVCCGCCVFLGRSFCVGRITRPEESYRLWCVWVWSWSLDNEEALTHRGAVTPW